MLRLKKMAEAAAATEPSRNSANALRESYGRLRAQVAELLQGSPEGTEFERVFPEPPSAGGDQRGGFGPAAASAATASRIDAAERFALLLRQMGGWLDGLIDEATFDQRMLYEAEASAKLRLDRG
jgi:hypothetical protein